MAPLEGFVFGVEEVDKDRNNDVIIEYSSNVEKVAQSGVEQYFDPYRWSFFMSVFCNV